MRQFCFQSCAKFCLVTFYTCRQARNLSVLLANPNTISSIHQNQTTASLFTLLLLFHLRQQQQQPQRVQRVRRSILLVRIVFGDLIFLSLSLPSLEPEEKKAAANKKEEYHKVVMSLSETFPDEPMNMLAAATIVAEGKIEAAALLLLERPYNPEVLKQVHKKKIKKILRAIITGIFNRLLID